MKVRPLRAGEVETLVADLWLPFVREMATLEGRDQPASEPAVREQAVAHRRDRLDDADAVTVVAESGDELVGFAEAEVRPSPPTAREGDDCVIRSVYADEDHRGAGLADELVARLEDWGRARGCAHAALDVHPHNESAKALYAGRGYELRGERLALAL